MKLFQFQVMGKPHAPRRSTWIEAAEDAVREHYAKWVSYPRVIHCQGGTEIARIN